MEITSIKSVFRTTSEAEANARLEAGWTMLDVIRTGNKLSYVLVRT
nr:hypothetical protein [Aneurinibacillus sp. XH2]